METGPLVSVRRHSRLGSRTVWFETETTCCPVCLNDRPLPPALSRADSLPVRTCSTCASRYVSPRPTERALARFYDSPKNLQMGTGYFARMEVAVSQGNYKTLASLPDPKTGRNRLLDVGCAAGYAMLCARRRGWSVTGAEPAALLARAGRERYELRIVRASCTELVDHFPAHSFDAVTAFDLVEHLSDLPGYFHQCKQLLKHGGVLLVDTPNVPSTVTPDQIQATRLRLNFESTFEHLSYLSIDSIRFLAYRSGFYIANWGTSGADWNQVCVSKPARRRARELLERVPGFSRLYWPMKSRGISAASELRWNDESGERLWVHLRRDPADLDR
jgi:SAM-dependent methyltransferase